MTDLAHIAAANSAPPAEAPPVRVGVSACLLGEEVRYDSGHKRDRFVDDVLRGYFELIPVCPEVAIGLGVPREPIRLEGDPDDPRAVGVRDKSLDVTERLDAYGREMGRELAGISGYILKSKSPSCGMERVKVYSNSGNGPAGKGRGIYARALMETQPLLPVEEEGRLNDPHLRENFIERVYAFRRWQALVEEGVTAERLVAFHTAHKLVLMAHGREQLRELGRLIADAGTRPIESLAEEYGHKFMSALGYKATRKRHTDVLQHLLGYLKNDLDAGDKAEMVEIIEDYRQGRVPLIVPITMFRHHFRNHPDPYIDKQLYLTWAPAGLSLWNAI